jgi:hypothetical protein
VRGQRFNGASRKIENALVQIFEIAKSSRARGSKEGIYGARRSVVQLQYDSDACDVAARASR